MKKTQRRVRCWMVTWPESVWQRFITSEVRRIREYRDLKRTQKSIRITPGHFVPDEVKRGRKQERTKRK